MQRATTPRGDQAAGLQSRGSAPTTAPPTSTAPAFSPDAPASPPPPNPPIRDANHPPASPPTSPPPPENSSPPPPATFSQSADAPASPPAPVPPPSFPTWHRRPADVPLPLFVFRVSCFVFRAAPRASPAISPRPQAFLREAS